MPTEPARDAATRKRDALARLDTDADAWVASADAAGNAYLVPLSFHWDGALLTMATPADSRTARNLRRAGRVRLGVGPTRDVLLIEADLVAEYAKDEVPDEVAEPFAAKLWDARRSPGDVVYLRFAPRRLQAWREENELAGRDLMRAGEWLV
jgi:hypothetical protein